MMIIIIMVFFCKWYFKVIFVYAVVCCFTAPHSTITSLFLFTTCLTFSFSSIFYVLVVMLRSLLFLCKTCSGDAATFQHICVLLIISQLVLFLFNFFLFIHHMLIHPTTPPHMHTVLDLRKSSPVPLRARPPFSTNHH